jgi:hypothetical protein
MCLFVQDTVVLNRHAVVSAVNKCGTWERARERERE